MDLANIWYL